MGKEGPNFGKEGPKDRLERVSREPTWAKKMVSREPAWAKKAPRIEVV